jgi:hypothetical protein
LDDSGPGGDEIESPHRQHSLGDPTFPGGEGILLAQADELLAARAQTGMPTIFAGDFNTNAEPGVAKQRRLPEDRLGRLYGHLEVGLPE